MSREILFKAKRKDNGEWVEGYYVKTTIGNDVTPSDIIFVPFKVSRNEKWGWIKIDPDTLCQYTGLTDKNGQKIWENDIVRHDFSKSIGSVKWHEKDYVGWCMVDVHYKEQMFDADMLKRCEVIVNIFDNTELLEVE